jgi:purine nucleoside permease
VETRRVLFAVSDDSGCRKDSEKLPFPQGYRDLRYNPDKGVLGIVTGVGTARAAASIMALGMDPRFDLSTAYWLVAGIAGVNPKEGSIGSAAWAEWVVDGDLGFEIDAREIPAGWPTGFIPLGKAQPYEGPATEIGGAVYHLDPGLATWAYEMTKNVKLEDTEIMRIAVPFMSATPRHKLRPPWCAATMFADQRDTAETYSIST